MKNKQPSTILYIEDNSANRLLVQMIIARRPGINFLAAENGAGGLALAATEVPDLILLDISLPDMDGCDVLARLRENPRTATIPVIAISGSPLCQDSPTSTTFDGYLAKPIDIEKFYATIDLYLQH